MVKSAVNVIRVSSVYFLLMSLLLCVSCAKKEFFYFSAPKANVHSPDAKWKLDSSLTPRLSIKEAPLKSPVSWKNLPLIASASSSQFPLVNAPERSKKLYKPRTDQAWKDQAKESINQYTKTKEKTGLKAKLDKLPVPVLATIGFWVGLSSLIFTLLGLAFLSSSGLLLTSVSLFVAGIVLNIIAKRKIKAHPDKFTGIKRARTGLCLSWTSFSLWLALVLLYLAAFSSLDY